MAAEGQRPLALQLHEDASQDRHIGAIRSVSMAVAAQSPAAPLDQPPPAARLPHAARLAHQRGELARAAHGDPASLLVELAGADIGGDSSWERSFKVQSRQGASEMSEHVSKLATVEPIFREAMRCNACFVHEGSRLQRSLVDIAQPRPIGENYWMSDFRIVLMLLNPGAGNVAQARPNQTFKQLLRAYADGSGSLEPVFQHQWNEMPDWGIPRGLFGRLYLDGYGLKLSEIAIANVAWCAELSNCYSSMLERCFKKHTLPLLSILEPDAILLAGDETQIFASPIQEACRRVEVVRAMHYRAFNFLPPAAKQDHLKAVREELDRIRLAKQLSRTGAGDFQGSHNKPSEVPGPMRAAVQPHDASVPRARIMQSGNRPNSGSRFGGYKIVDPNAIARRANKRDDPRWEFWDAMTILSRYEDYFVKFGDMKVYPETHRSKPRNAHTEMAWARKQGWIIDA
jgi:hypothetical protein